MSIMLTVLMAILMYIYYRANYTLQRRRIIKNETFIAKQLYAAVVQLLYILLVF